MHSDKGLGEAMALSAVEGKAKKANERIDQLERRVEELEKALRLHFGNGMIREHPSNYP